MMAKKFEQDCSHSVQSVFEKGDKDFFGAGGKGGGDGEGKGAGDFLFLLFIGPLDA